MRVDGEIVVVIATHTPRGVHHPGYFEPRESWFSRGKKQALDLRGQLYVLEKFIPLLPNGSGQRFPLFHVTPYYVNNQGEAQHRGEIVEEAKSRIYSFRRIIVVK